MKNFPSRPYTSPMITEHLPNGRTMHITFKGPIKDLLQELYLKNRADIQDLGLEGALQKWHDEEAVERRKLGLKVRERY